MVRSIQSFGIVASRLSIFRAFLSTNRRYATMSETLNKVPDVDIDGHGRFKYILINVQDENTKATKPIVRGYAKSPYHADIFEEACKQLEPYSSLKPNCVGGGRIEHDPDAKTIKVYGYSQGFGKADHQVSVGVLKKKYLDYTITCSDEGY
ncbi:sex-regulated protein janus-A [Megalopta genalis]|uniref:sex-regulated protein janus-A n=1 Tax=Megalopta genalis TaxID=115081 RepID=UPI00144323EE|nr:sex-regulated protein janus-A-like [Megalopta genalis]